ncbi:hypothetical protein P7C70_g4570, partial [Phenoliferia sp. Uapishka_3]
MSHRASLNACPAEIKALIVESAAAQDSAYASRAFMRYAGEEDKDTGKEGATEVAETKYAIDGYGQTLGTLRLLNKEFSELGAGPMFSTIHSNRTTDTIFRYRILQSYSSSVERIDFARDTSEVQVGLIIASLDRFVNLRHLDFASAQTVDFIMGENWFRDLTPASTEPTSIVDPNFEHSSFAFKAMALRIEDLHLGERWNLYDVPPFLALFPNLKTLKLVADFPNDAHRPIVRRLSTAVKALQQLASLETLGKSHWGQSWYTGWAEEPSVRKLSVRPGYLAAGHWKTAECLGAHLEVLEIYFNSFENDGDFKANFPIPIPLDGTILFPKLKRLVLQCVPPLDNPVVSTFLAHFTSLPIFNLEVSIGHAGDASSYLPYFPHVKKLEIRHENYGRLATAEAIHRSSTQCAAKGIECHITSSEYTSTRACDLSTSPTPSPEQANQALNFAAIQRALNFGHHRLRQAKLDDEFDWGLKRPMLESLEHLRLAWED